MSSLKLLNHQLITAALHHAHQIELLKLYEQLRLVCQVVLIACVIQPLDLEYVPNWFALSLIFELPSLYAFGA